jgi:hypothetical protein
MSNVTEPVANYKGFNIYVSQNPNWKYYITDDNDNFIGIGQRHKDQYFDIIGVYSKNDSLDDKLRSVYYNTHPNADTFGTQEWFTAQILFPMDINYNHKFLVNLPELLKSNNNLQTRISSAQEKKRLREKVSNTQLSAFSTNQTPSQFSFGVPASLSAFSTPQPFSFGTPATANRITGPQQTQPFSFGTTTNIPTNATTSKSFGIPMEFSAFGRSQPSGNVARRQQQRSSTTRRGQFTFPSNYEEDDEDKDDRTDTD